MTPESEAQRRARLRIFLTNQRARLTPTDVGLPQTPRRRVVGLRREEVAELAGVSSDWYRWFESGRPIRVSPPFLARLADALHLDPPHRETLYRLALPELFETVAPHVPEALLDLTSPLQAGDEINDVIRTVAKAREVFLTQGMSPVPNVRPRVARSWMRSLKFGVDPDRRTAVTIAQTAQALAERRENKHYLIDAVRPIVDNLRNALDESGYALVLSDESGCVIEMWGNQHVLRTLSKIDLEPGTDLSEGACGTNAVGTAIFDARALQVIGAENFCEGGGDLTCTAAPIRDPATREITGAIDATASCRLIYPEMISIINQAALEIEEHLAVLTS